MRAILESLRTWSGIGAAPVRAYLPISGAMLSDVGAVRDNNEDSVAFVLPAAGRHGLALVADGMGGHAAGEVASLIAAKTVVDVFYTAAGTVPGRLSKAFAAANRAIREHVSAAPQTAGMGTTCTALAFVDGGVYLAHVGDSRAYLVRGELIRQISEDHSLVAQLVAQGKLSAEEAAGSPDSNVILRALGIGDDVAPQVTGEALKLAPGDGLVLCSDGLSDVVTNETIRATVLDAATPERACRALIEAALAQGGPDNISVGVFLVCCAAQAPQPGVGRATRQTPVPAECAP